LAEILTILVMRDRKHRCYFAIFS